MAAYPRATEVVWCQEEPQNQGAWYQIQHRLQEPLHGEQRTVLRRRGSAAAPAAGIFQLHVQQQQALVEARLQNQRLTEDRKHEHRSQSSATAGVCDATPPWCLAQEAGQPVSGTRTWSIWKPTRSCWRCRRRRAACSGNSDRKRRDRHQRRAAGDAGARRGRRVAAAAAQPSRSRRRTSADASPASAERTRSRQAESRGAALLEEHDLDARRSRARARRPDPEVRCMQFV